MIDKIEVTKEEFEKFIKEYPRELVKHGVYFCTPPVLLYCDFEIGKYPDNVVARLVEGMYGEKPKYYIMKGD